MTKCSYCTTEAPVYLLELITHLEGEDVQETETLCGGHLSELFAYGELGDLRNARISKILHTRSTP
jgi:hypothetical protein